MLALALLLALGADEVVARVDGQVVLASDLSSRSATQQPAAAPVALQELIGEAALAAEAARLGLDRDPRVVAEVEARRRKLAAERLLDKEIAQAPGDEVVRGLYHSQADTVRLQMVVFTSRAEAAESLARLRKGGDLLAEAKRSVDPSWKNGKPQDRTRGSLEGELLVQAFSAPPKEWRGPLELRLGFAVFQVLQRTLGDEKGYAERREGLVRFAAQQLKAQAKAHYLTQLRRQVGVQVDEDFVRSTEKRLEATAAERAHPVARIRGRAITWGEVLPEVEALARGKSAGHFSGPAVKLEVVHHLVNQRLLEDAALERGHGKAPEVEAALEPARRDALVRARSQDLRAAAGRASDADVERFYAANPTRFEQPGRRTCSHVLLRSRDLASAARQRIRAGTPLEEVARESSIDPQSAAQGGLLGEIVDDKLQAFAGEEAALAAAFRDAKANEVTEPVQSRAGWHVVRCGPHQPARLLPLADVRAELAGHLTQQLGDEAIRARIAAARTQARVSVDEAALARSAAPAQ